MSTVTQPWCYSLIVDRFRGVSDKIAYRALQQGENETSGLNGVV